MSGHLHRFFVEPLQVRDGQIRILNPDARQIRTVLRLKEGDRLAALDGSGNCYLGEITAIDREQVCAAVSEVCSVATEPAVHLTLAQGLPKGDKYSLIIQKGTELGISEYVGVICARSVTRAADVSLKQARWLRIAKEAAEQCGRGKVPVIRGVDSFRNVLNKGKDHDLALVGWEKESSVLLSEVLRSNGSAKRVMLLIGPEGGFTGEEIEAAQSAGFVTVSLGRRMLRAETAAIAASAIVLYELEGHL